MNTHTLTKKPSKKEDVFEEYPALLATLLLARGITERDEAEVFLNPDYEKHLHDPFLMKDMDRAVSRILGAMGDGESIAIYSDYDCDGIPAAVVLHDFFRKVEYPHFQNYIPHRHEEGYGLNRDAIEKLKNCGVSLIITADVGITDVDEVMYAQTLGIDVIITDHHLPGPEIPRAHAVVNSKRFDDSYPYPDLCGSGVAFKLVQALLRTGDFSAVKDGWEKWLLDVVGIATIADMVPLTGENRVLAYYGLKVLRKSRRPGLMKLCRKMNLKQQYLNEDDVGFMIAPRINAASRMDRPDEAFHLLRTTDEVEGGIYAEHLHKINNERKGVVAAMVREIKKELKERSLPGGVIVLGNPKWKPSLLGLVANTLVEEYGKTVCLWGEEGGGLLKGSCRSDGKVSVVELMERAGDSLVEYGGHQFSGGFSVTRDKVHALEEVFFEAYEKAEQLELNESTQTNASLELKDITWDTYRLIELLGPFGEGNPKPAFLFKGVEVVGVRQFGKGNEHLELSFVDGSGRTIPALSFFSNINDYQTDITVGKKVDLIAHIEKSTFKRNPELRLRIINVC